MKILQQAPDVFLQTAKVSNSYVILEEGITPFPPLESGNFTPTTSNEVDCSVSVLRGLYSRVGNIVTMSVYFSVTLDALVVGGSFNLSLPVASTFTNGRDLFGVMNVMTNQISTILDNYIIAADTVNNDAIITVGCPISTPGITMDVLVANIQYIVQ